MLFRSSSLVESRLHVDNAELAVRNFAVCCHRPEEANAMAGNGNVRVIEYRYHLRFNQRNTLLLLILANYKKPLSRVSNGKK